MSIIRIALDTAAQGPDLWDAGVAFGSAVAGAVVGAVPAFILAKRSSKEVLRRDREARTEKERTLVLRVHWKLGTILNSIISVHQELARQLDPEKMPGGEPWQKVLPIIGLGAEYDIAFEVDELVVFLAAKAGDLAEGLTLLSKRHYIHKATLDEFATRKERLRRDMPTPESIDGQVAVNRLTQEQALRLRPQMVGLNSLIEQLVDVLEQDLAMAIALADRYNDVARAYFADPHFPAFVIPAEARSLVTPSQ